MTTRTVDTDIFASRNLWNRRNRLRRFIVAALENTDVAPELMLVKMFLLLFLHLNVKMETTYTYDKCMTKMLCIHRKSTFQINGTRMTVSSEGTYILPPAMTFAMFKVTVVAACKISDANHAHTANFSFPFSKVSSQGVFLSDTAV